MVWESTLYARTDFKKLKECISGVIFVTEIWTNHRSHDSGFTKIILNTHTGASKFPTKLYVTVPTLDRRIALFFTSCSDKSFSTKYPSSLNYCLVPKF